MKLTTAGESHGKALVAIIEGLPSHLRIETEKINGAGLFYDPRRFFCALTGKSLFFVLKMT